MLQLSQPKYGNNKVILEDHNLCSSFDNYKKGMLINVTNAKEWARSITHSVVKGFVYRVGPKRFTFSESKGLGKPIEAHLQI